MTYHSPSLNLRSCNLPTLGGIQVRFGRWVLLENIGESIDAALEPLLLQQKFKQGGTEMIKIGDSVIPWNDAFKFFMTTKLPNPHYPPEVCVKVSLINFAITFTGLEDQLLGTAVVEEMPEMEEKKVRLPFPHTHSPLLPSPQGYLLIHRIFIHTCSHTPTNLPFPLPRIRWLYPMPA